MSCTKRGKISCKGVAAAISLCIFLFALTHTLIVAIYVFFKELKVKQVVINEQIHKRFFKL